MSKFDEIIAAHSQAQQAEAPKEAPLQMAPPDADTARHALHQARKPLQELIQACKASGFDVQHADLSDSSRPSLILKFTVQRGQSINMLSGDHLVKFTAEEYPNDNKRLVIVTQIGNKPRTSSEMLAASANEWLFRETLLGLLAHALREPPGKPTGTFAGRPLSYE